MKDKMVAVNLFVISWC